MLTLLMGLKAISPNDLNRIVENKTVTVIDVNSTQSWKTAHVPTALNLDPASFSESDLPEDKDSEVVFYCSNVMCRKGPSAAVRARKMGYRNVKVMSAGIKGWLAAKLPVQSA